MEFVGDETRLEGWVHLLVGEVAGAEDLAGEVDAQVYGLGGGVPSSFGVVMKSVPIRF